MRVAYRQLELFANGATIHFFVNSVLLHFLMTPATYLRLCIVVCNIHSEFMLFAKIERTVRVGKLHAKTTLGFTLDECDFHTIIC